MWQEQSGQSGQWQERSLERKSGTYHAECYRGFGSIGSAVRSPWEGEEQVLNRSLVPGEMARDGRGTIADLERPVRKLSWLLE